MLDFAVFIGDCMTNSADIGLWLLGGLGTRALIGEENLEIYRKCFLRLVYSVLIIFSRLSAFWLIPRIFASYFMVRTPPPGISKGDYISGLF